MAMRNLKKTAHFRVVDLVYEDGATDSRGLALADFLKECRENYSNPHEIFPLSNDYECIVVSHEVSGDFEFIHLASFERGEGAGIIADIHGENDHKVDEIAPPKTDEFIRSQLFLVCRKNHVSWISHGSPVRASRVHDMLQKFLEAFYTGGIIPKPMLMTPINEEAFKRLMNEGIHSIELRTTSFPEQMAYIKNNKRVPGSLASMLRREEIDDDSIDAASKVQNTVILKPGRRWGLPTVKVMLARIAAGVIDQADEDEGFIIKTKQKHKLTKKDMTITQEFEVRGNSQRLESSQDAFGKLQKIFDSMVNAAG